MTDHIIYKLIVFAIVMPMNGFIISRSKGWWRLVGILLILVQIPWFLSVN